jgi:hypothetical protein
LLFVEASHGAGDLVVHIALGAELRRSNAWHIPVDRI